MSTILMRARDLVQTFKGETYAIEDRDVDQRVMTRHQLEKLGDGYRRVAEMAAEQERRVRADIEQMKRDHSDDVREDIRRVALARASRLI